MEYTGHIKIVAKMPVAPGNVEKFIALAAELIQASRTEEGRSEEHTSELQSL